MTKTVANKPQTINDSQWLLTWQGSARTDVVTAIVDGSPSRVNPFDRNSAVAAYFKPDTQSNGLLMDLGRVPNEVKVIDFTLDVMVEGSRSWTFEGLGTGEVWQNDSVRVPADAPCLLISLERADGDWSVVAREKILGEQGDITVDDQIPEQFRDLVAKATARGLAEDSIHFTAIVDITPTMNQEHDEGSVEKVLNCLVAIAGSANNRPIQVSFQGVHSVSMSVDEDINALYTIAVGEAAAFTQQAKPLHTLIPEVAAIAKSSSTIFVVTDSMFFIEDDLIDELRNRDARLRILLIGEDSNRFDLPPSEEVRIKHLGNITQLDAKAVIERLS